MSGMRRWLHCDIAKAFVAVLLALQITPAIQACPLPMLDVSMAYASLDMPEVCAGFAKQACLGAYIQADRTVGGAGAAIVAHLAMALRAMFPTVLVLAARNRAADAPSAHAGAPPPHLLFCPMRE